jgi:RNA polymerase sigma-70 factor (ECF subfamily)
MIEVMANGTHFRVAAVSPEIAAKSDYDPPVIPGYLTDEELVERTQAGDVSAFDTLVLRYRHRLTAIAWRFFPDPADAEDMAQEAFVRAFTNLEKLRSGVPFRNWLYRLTTNLCLDRVRRERRRPRQVEPALTQPEEEWLERQLYRDETDGEPRFVQRLVAEQLISRVLERIAPRDRLVLHLLYCEGRSVAEVADILKWTKANVKVRAFRARRTLRKYLSQLDAVSEG